MKSYCVYILKCNDDTYYTGITNDLDRRFVEHSSGLIKTCYTYTRRPIHIAFYQIFSDVNQAIMFEKKIKKWSKAKKEALINNNLHLLKSLSECKNETNSNYFNKDEMS